MSHRVAVHLLKETRGAFVQPENEPNAAYYAIVYNAHVQDGVPERVLAIWIGTALDQVVVDVLVTETSCESQRILSVIGET